MSYGLVEKGTKCVVMYNIIRLITNDWGKLIFLYLVGAISINFLCYAWAHDLLSDFLVGSIGRKNAKELRKRQKLKNKALLDYIPPEIRSNHKSFSKYYYLYKLWLYSRIVLICVFLSTLFVTTQYKIAALLLDVFTTFIIATIYRLPSWPNGTSDYSRKN